jgi:hypothetical protein
MNTHKETKINQLLQALPSGTVATSRWLESMGISRSHVTGYVRTGWLDRFGTGAVIRRGRQVGWMGAVYSLQAQLSHSIHPGGKTALGLLGSLHYVPMGSAPVTLFHRNRENIPKWFSQHQWPEKIATIGSDLFEKDDTLGLTDFPVDEFKLKISSHERAFLEYLHCLEDVGTGDEPVKIMESLAWLRPVTIQMLLETCGSIKVKRLFLVLAEHADHPWLKKIDLSRVDIGKGKRQFVKGGFLHPKFQITIPGSWRQQAATV